MGTALEFTWDSRDLDVWRGGKVESALARALSKAGGDAIRAMRSGSIKSVREKKRMKVSTLSKALPLTFPRGKEIGDLAWRMDVSGKGMPVSAFPFRQVGRPDGRRHGGGVSVSINVGSSKLLKGAFIATMRSGHKGVFYRQGKGRLPIDEAFTTRVSDVFKNQGFIPSVHAIGQSAFATAFERLLPFELSKLKP